MGKLTAKVFNLEGKVAGKIKIPNVFKTPLRLDIIKKAVVTLQSHRIQPQGRDPLAGKRTTAESLGVGLGIARVPRKKGTQRAAFMPGAVKGRAAHPPVSQKRIRKNMPKKEMRLALCSAIAATARPEIVASRGHVIESIPDFPLIVTDEIQNLKKTKEIEEVFLKLGIWPDIFRVQESQKIRAGKGKGRGRRKKQAKGPLIVIAENGGITRAVRNIPGAQVVQVNNLNVELLAPGTHAGRLTIWTYSAIQKLDSLFGVD